MTLRSSGPTALLVDEVEHPGLWAQAFSEALVGGVIAIVPGERSVLIHFDAGYGDEIRAHAERLEREPVLTTARPAPVEHVVDVDFDGPDLGAVAAARPTWSNWMFPEVR